MSRNGINVWMNLDVLIGVFHGSNSKCPGMGLICRWVLDISDKTMREVVRNSIKLQGV